MRNPILVLLFTTLALGVLAPTASAIQPAPEPEYVSPDRDKCEAELAKDHKWAAALEAKIRAVYKNEVRPDVHKEDASLMMTNKRHVVMAYAALWILVVGFLALLFLRQQKLVAEIARLERDLSKAVEEED